VSTVDSALRQRDDQHQLLSLATARIESYDAIEAPTDECVKVSAVPSSLSTSTRPVSPSPSRRDVAVLTANDESSETYR